MLRLVIFSCCAGSCAALRLAALRRRAALSLPLLGVGLVNAGLPGPARAIDTQGAAAALWSDLTGDLFEAPAAPVAMTEVQLRFEQELRQAVARREAKLKEAGQKDFALDADEVADLRDLLATRFCGKQGIGFTLDSGMRDTGCVGGIGLGGMS